MSTELQEILKMIQGIKVELEELWDAIDVVNDQLQEIQRDIDNK